MPPQSAARYLVIAAGLVPVRIIQLVTVGHQSNE
jgi:hypothetical protein